MKQFNDNELLSLNYNQIDILERDDIKKYILEKEKKIIKK